MSKNADLEARRKDFKMVHLDENLKNELRKSHFIMGSFTPNYNTTFNCEFNKKDFVDNNLNNKNKANNIKSEGHKMGIDKVIYKSETHNKFIAPDINKTMGILK